MRILTTCGAAAAARSDSDLILIGVFLLLQFAPGDRRSR
jgi:hypothetical protein